MYRMLPILLVALAVVMLTSPPAVMAADDVTVEGKVVKAADGKLTITDKDDKEHVTTVAADAKITCDGKECKLEDLKKDIKVKVLDKDTAVVTGTIALKNGKYKEGDQTADVSGEYRWVDTFARRSGQWKVVASATVKASAAALAASPTRKTTPAPAKAAASPVRAKTP